jgi:hypothetical protein
MLQQSRANAAAKGANVRCEVVFAGLRSALLDHRRLDHLGVLEVRDKCRPHFDESVRGMACAPLAGGFA